MAGSGGPLGLNSACSIRGLIWALGRFSCIKPKPEALKIKGKKCILELKLIDAYEQLEKILPFIDIFKNIDQTTSDGTGSWKDGVYIKIFGNGIIEVIHSFSEDLREMERSLLLEPTSISVHSLASAQLMIDSYQAINNIIQQICDRNIRGCQILDVCYKYALKSQEMVHQKVNILVQSLHKQMIKQIKSWILYGELSDRFKEFFIKQCNCNNDFNLHTSLHNQTSIDSSISGDFSVSLIESTTATLPFDKKAQEIISDDIDNYYEIDGTQVPSHLPYSLVSKIFSLGKFMIQIINNPSNKIPVRFMTVNLNDYGLEESNIRIKFQELEDSTTFHHHILDQLVDSIWCQINKYMKKVAEEEGELSIHNRNIIDVYLMGRGELFRHFLDKASNILINDASKVFSRSLDIALERVAQDLYGTDDVKFLKKFYFSLPPKRETPPGRSALSVMKLLYKSPWPLPLIYTQEALDTYNIIFKFLIDLKRSHIALNISWNDINEISQEMYNRSANDLHFRLISLITNLESYVFIDVIQSEIEIFCNIVDNSDSFDDIQLAHAKFLSNVIMRLFLPSNKGFSVDVVADCQSVSFEINKNVGMVHKEIMNLFLLTHQFSMAVRVKSFSSSYKSDDGSTKLNELIKNFDSLVINLLSLVKKINERYCSEYLRMLIMRLDYNEYYSNQCGIDFV